MDEDLDCDRWMFLMRGLDAIKDTTRVMKKQLKEHHWKIRRMQESDNGSRYIFAQRSKDKLVVRISNHKMTRNAKRIAKIVFGRGPDFSLHPGSMVTISWIMNRIR